MIGVSPGTMVVSFVFDYGLTLAPPGSESWVLCCGREERGAMLNLSQCCARVEAGWERGSEARPEFSHMALPS